jgi:hypothetical protein
VDFDLLTEQLRQLPGARRLRFRRPLGGNSRHNGLFGSIDRSAPESVCNRRKQDAFCTSFALTSLEIPAFAMAGDEERCGSRHWLRSLGLDGSTALAARFDPEDLRAGIGSIGWEADIRAGLWD